MSNDNNQNWDGYSAGYNMNNNNANANFWANQWNNQGAWQQSFQQNTTQNGNQNTATGTQNTSASFASGWFSFSDTRYLKGLALGAGVAILLTNPKIQKGLLKGAINMWAAVQGGFEELKEQVEDIKSEMSMHSDD